MQRFGKFGGVMLVIDGKGSGFFFGIDKEVNVLLSFHFLKS